MHASTTVASTFAGSVFVVFLSAGILNAQSAPTDHLVRDAYGEIIRGDTSVKKVALIFTGDEFAESTEPIFDTLKERKITAGFFVTGNFVRQRSLRPLLL